jgi:hypothetical protein
MSNTLRDKRRDAAVDAEWVDDLRYRLGQARLADPVDYDRVRDLERQLRKAEDRAGWSDFEAHRFDDERD